MKDVRVAYELAKKSEVGRKCVFLHFDMFLYYSDMQCGVDAVCDLPFLQSAQKWKQLSELAIAKSQFGLAMDCLYSAKDYSGLMLLASSAGDATTVDKIATVASSEGQNNLAFMSNFLLGR